MFPLECYLLQNCNAITNNQNDLWGEIMAKYEQLAYAIWSWGLQDQEQMITGIKDIKEAGYRYFESVASAIDLFRSDLAGFKAICDDYQVYPVSFYFWGTGNYDTDVNTVKNGLEFLAANNITRMSFQASYKENGGASPEELALTVRTLNTIAEIAKPFGVTPCLHPHANTMVMYESDIDFVMQNTDPALVAFGPDTAHLTVGRCDAVEIFKRYVDRIKFTHIKDVKKSMGVNVDDSEKQGFEIYSDFLELGTGDVDLPGVFAVLDAAGYDGYLTVELDQAPVSQRESAFNNMAYLKKLLQLEPSNV